MENNTVVELEEQINEALKQGDKYTFKETLNEVLEIKNNHFITNNFYSWISEDHPIDNTFINMTKWLNELAENYEKIELISVKENHIDWKESIGVDIFVDVVVRVWN